MWAPTPRLPDGTRVVPETCSDNLKWSFRAEAVPHVTRDRALFVFGKPGDSDGVVNRVFVGKHNTRMGVDLPSQTSVAGVTVDGQGGLVLKKNNTYQLTIVGQMLIGGFRLEQTDGDYVLSNTTRFRAGYDSVDLGGYESADLTHLYLQLQLPINMNSGAYRLILINHQGEFVMDGFRVED